jgi:hypothetical protein
MPRMPQQAWSRFNRMHFKCGLRFCKISFAEPERDVDQADERRNLDQWSNNADKRFARVQTEDCNGHCNCQLEVVARSRKGERRGLSIIRAQVLAIQKLTRNMMRK